MNDDYLINRQIIVIIPVYNGREYLNQAVKSVISQPYKEIKVILVDDGSTDGSSLLCDELASRDERISVLHQSNKGVAEARNKGLKYVLSDQNNIQDYVTFLDADDVWEDNCINIHIRKILKKGYDLIGLQACRCNHSLTRRTQAFCMQEGEYKGGVSSIWIHAKQHMGAMLYRLGLIKNYGIQFYNIKASEDKIFSMQCLYLADRIYLVNQLMYLYRQNVTSTVHIRNKGILYFAPIIDAYIQSDMEMTQWSNGTRGKLQEGTLLAKIYIMDMIEEELESVHGVKRLADLFIKRPDYQKIVETQSNHIQVDKRWIYMCENKYRIAIKNWLHGFSVNIAKSIYYIRPVKCIIDRKRYPIKM